MGVDLEAWGANDVPKAARLLRRQSQDSAQDSFIPSPGSVRYTSAFHMYETQLHIRLSLYKQIKCFINVFCEFKYLSKQICENTEIISVKYKAFQS